MHSSYSRSVSTLPIHGKKVEITAIVRRFRCRNPKCGKTVFTAQIEGLTERYSRRSVSARGFLRELLVPVPATVGARQATASGIPISASTALRIVYGAEPRIDYGAIKRICIDDFACRKGQTYRTLIADADTGLPVEIIGSRDESDVAKALKKYKKVSVVSRDRAGAYSKAISKARPRARQVADRFHLVKNCGDHVKEALRNNQLAIRKEVERHAQTPPASKASSLFHPPTPEDIGLFNKARELRSKGRSLEGIARELGSSRWRITGICNSDAPHGRKVTTPKMILPYLDAIEKGIAAGKGYKRILADILESGGSMSLEALTRGMNKLYPLYRPRRGDPSTAEKKNLAWAVDHMTALWEKNASLAPEDLMKLFISEAETMRRADIASCMDIGRFGLPCVHDNDVILTHCNAGALATAGYGTALGVVRAAFENRKNIRVIADETRPFLQGARLTAWELQRDGIPVTVACDNACASLMSRGFVSLCVVGADRIAANGDTANKIGTLGVAILARHYGIPFYVAAPLSTIDRSTPDGKHIPIEERPASEVTTIGSTRVTPEGVPVFNFAFDVTPADLITGIITDKGLLTAPYDAAIRDVFAREEQ